MKPKRTVCFLYSEKEIDSVLSYIKSHPTEEIYFFSPLLSTQLKLKSLGMNYWDYNNVCCKGENFYSQILAQLHKKAGELSDHICQTFRSVTILDVPFFNLLQNTMEMEFIDVLYAEYLYRQILIDIKPQRFVVSNNMSINLSGWSGNFFSSAAIITQSLAKKETNFLDKKMNVNIAVKQRFFLTRSYIKYIPLLLKLFLQRNRQPFQGIIKPCDFLLFSGGINLAYYENVFSDVVLKRRGITGVIVTANQTLEDESLVRNAGITHISINKFITNDIYTKASREAVKITNEFYKKSKQMIIFPNYLVSKNVADALNQKLNLIVNKYAKKTALQMYVADQVLSITHPKLIITTHDPAPSASPFVLLAKKKNIQTLVLLHGLHYTIFGQRYWSDHMAAWGSELKHFYEQKMKKSKNTIHAVGFPYVDDTYNKVKKSSLPQFSLNKVVNIGVLLAFYPPVESTAKFLYELYAAAMPYKNKIRLNVRGHPGQEIEGVHALKKIFPIAGEVNILESIERFVCRNDVFISWETTALLWPMLWSKPLFLATSWWGSGHLPLSRYKAAWLPRSAEELFTFLFKLPDHLEKLVALQKGQRLFLKDFVGGKFQSSATAHLKLIEKLTKK